MIQEADFYFPVFEAIVNKRIPKQKTGRPRTDLRKIFHTIVFVDKTGIQWGMVPPCEELAPGTTTHDNFQLFERLGIIEEFFATVQKMYSDHVGYKTRWTSVDCTIIPTRVIALQLGKECTGKNPTDRGRAGTKVSSAVDQTGAIMGFTIDGANIHDSKLLEETLVQGSLMSLLYKKNVDRKKHLCLDKGYDGNKSEECAFSYGYVSHIRTRGEEKLEKKIGKKSKRFVVEAQWAWIKSFRHVRTRFTKYARNFNALLQFTYSHFLMMRIMPVINGPITLDMIPDVDMDDHYKWLEMQRAW